jgi:voltage-gated potassium channel
MQQRLRRLGEQLDWPVGLLALLVVPALILENRSTSPDVQRIAFAINWIVWGSFCFHLLIAIVADPTWETLRRRWFDVLLVLISPPFLVPTYLQATRSLRVLRVLRLLRLIRVGVVATFGFRMTQRLLRHKQFHYIGLVAICVIGLGATGLFLLEGETNPSIHSFGDALWWAVVTATTVGYGDVSPTTTEGRLIAVVLMVTGIGVIGVFTATVASFFFEQDRGPSLTEMTARLDAIEGKLDQLLSRDKTDL